MMRVPKFDVLIGGHGSGLITDGTWHWSRYSGQSILWQDTVDYLFPAGTRVRISSCSKERLGGIYDAVEYVSKGMTKDEFVELYGETIKPIDLVRLDPNRVAAPGNTFDFWSQNVDDIAKVMDNSFERKPQPDIASKASALRDKLWDNDDIESALRAIPHNYKHGPLTEPVALTFGKDWLDYAAKDSKSKLALAQGKFQAYTAFSQEYPTYRHLLKPKLRRLFDEVAAVQDDLLSYVASLLDSKELATVLKGVAGADGVPTNVFDAIGKFKEDVNNLFVGTKQAITGTYDNAVTKGHPSEVTGLTGLPLEDARIAAKARTDAIDPIGANDVGVVYKVNTPMSNGFDFNEMPVMPPIKDELKALAEEFGASPNAVKNAMTQAKKKTMADMQAYLTKWANKNLADPETFMLKYNKRVDALLQARGYDHKVLKTGRVTVRTPLVDVELEPLEKVATHSNAEGAFAEAKLHEMNGQPDEAIAASIRGLNELKETYAQRLNEVDDLVGEQVDNLVRNEETLRLQVEADRKAQEAARLQAYEQEDFVNELADADLDDTIPPHCI